MNPSRRFKRQRNNVPNRQLTVFLTPSRRRIFFGQRDELQARGRARFITRPIAIVQILAGEFGGRSAIGAVRPVGDLAQNRLGSVPRDGAHQATQLLHAHLAFAVGFGVAAVQELSARKAVENDFGFLDGDHGEPCPCCGPYGKR